MKKQLKRVIKRVKLEEIDRPDVVDRMEISAEKIKELAGSISEVGLLQPVLLRPTGERYEVVAGHRRVLACRALELDMIDAVVKKMDDKEAAIIRATENLRREDLTPIEEAVIFGNLLNKHKMSVNEIAKKFGYKGGTVMRRLDLNKMPEDLRMAVHEKRISVSVAEELWPITDDAELDYYLGYALDGGCTRDVARAWCKEWRDKKRRAEQASGDGGQHYTPSEPRPVYVACDICLDAMKIGDETVLRVCKGCYTTIKANM